MQPNYLINRSIDEFSFSTGKAKFGISKGHSFNILQLILVFIMLPVILGSISKYKVFEPRTILVERFIAEVITIAYSTAKH